MSPPGARIGELDRAAIVETVLSRLGSQRSAWNAPDIRGEVEQQLTKAGVVAEGVVRRELAEDLVARAVEASVPLIPSDNTPEHVRALTSPQVLEVEERLTTRLTTRAQQPALPGRTVGWEQFDDAQLAALTAIDGNAQLLVIEGAAGAGKTQMLAAARAMAETRRRHLVVVTPTLKASQVATRELGTRAFSAAWLTHQHGYRWDDEGRRTREPESPVPLAATLRRDDILLVDEAGMLDQDTALALLTIADEAQARLVLVGDRHQLPAVGRGGVLDLATDVAPASARFSLDVVHRFEDPEYAELSPADAPRRTPGRGLRPPPRARRDPHPRHRRRTTPRPRPANPDSSSPTPETKWPTLNDAIRARRMADGELNLDGPTTTTLAGQTIGVGDQIATRRNDPDLDVANRDTWTVTDVHDDGGLDVRDGFRIRHLPHHYVAYSR